MAKYAGSEVIKNSFPDSFDPLSTRYLGSFTVHNDSSVEILSNIDRSYQKNASKRSKMLSNIGDNQKNEGTHL